MIELIGQLLLLVFALLVPGYFAVLALFPKKGELSGIERFAFSFVFSIALTPLALILENILLGIPLNEYSVFGTVVAIILIGGAGWLYRKKELGKKAVPLIPETIQKTWK